MIDEWRGLPTMADVAVAQAAQPHESVDVRCDDGYGKDWGYGE